VEIAVKSAKPILLLFMALSIEAPAIVRHLWPVYGPWLVHVAAGLAQDIAPSQHILVAGMIVFTPQTEVLISTECSGAQGVRTLSIIAVVVLLLNWRHATNLRFLLLYLGSEAILWLYNLARLAYEISYGQKQYGVSEMMVVIVAGLLALGAVRMARPPGGLSTVAGSVRPLEQSESRPT
jgi:hypothetical protein